MSIITVGSIKYLRINSYEKMSSGMPSTTLEFFHCAGFALAICNDLNSSNWSIAQCAVKIETICREDYSSGVGPEATAQ